MADRVGWLPPLAKDEVERIMARLAVRYGTMLSARYGELDPLAVQLDWSEELRGIGPAAIDFALENLPVDRPPTAGQFRELCRRAPAEKQLALPAPPPRRKPPAEFLAARGRIAAASGSILDAARKLRQRELDELAEARAGRPYRRLTMAQKTSWRQALGWPLNWPADEEPPKSRPVGDEAQP